MNNVSFVGRVTKDIDLQKSKGDLSYCAFTLAVKRMKTEEGGQDADFPRIVAFGKIAENAANYVKKGSLIAVEGRVQTGKYENNEGDTVYTTEFIASRIEYLNLSE